MNSHICFQVVILRPLRSKSFNELDHCGLFHENEFRERSNHLQLYLLPTIASEYTAIVSLLNAIFISGSVT